MKSVQTVPMQNPQIQQILALHQSGRLPEAAAAFGKLLTELPQDSRSLTGLGTAALQMGNLEEGLRLLEMSLELDPDQPAALAFCGAALASLKRHNEAVELLDRALVIRPDFAEAHFNRGLALKELNRLEEASASYGNALAVRPDFAEAYFNRGAVLRELGRFDEALADYDRALASRPGFAEAQNNRGIVLHKLNRLEEALSSFDKTLAVRTDYADAHYNRGVVLKDLDRLDDALASYDRALAINPENAEVYFNRGAVLRDLDRLDEALASYEKALAIKPELDLLAGESLHTRMHLADWKNFQDWLQQVVRKIANNEDASAPLPVQALIDSPELQLRAAERYAARRFPASLALSDIVRRPRTDRIRVGYFSSDFGDHPVTHLLAGMFEWHDKTRFETFAFSHGPERHDSWRSRVVNSVDHFLDVRARSDHEIAMLARDIGLDIAVDLNGFTHHARPGIFALRAAPVQASYIGFLGTMGAPYMDYLVADGTLIPEESRQYYAEKIACLPCYQCNDDRQKISGRVFLRKEAGLPGEGFVFCSFNNNYKITPDVFDCWMSILRQVPASVLWLYATNPTAISNLRSEAERRGVSSSRLVFADRLPLEEHLSRQRLADLFLDTHPYNAGATASNALRAGLPVLTRVGKCFAGRMGASLLNAVGLSELITGSPEEYEALAVQLATDPGQLASVKRKLAENLPASPLFDTERFTRNMEAAFRAMYERYQNDLPPDHICLSNNDATKSPRVFTMKTLLHVGCGRNNIGLTTKGFNNGEWQELRLDIDESVNPDILGTMTDMSKVGDKSVDAIFSSHNIEHLYAHEVPVALREFIRVLKDDGFCVITCPDLKSVCELVAQDKLTEAAYVSPAGPIAPIDMLYGHRGFMGRGNLFMAHRCGFTEKVLRSTLYSAGFKSVASISVPSTFSLWAIACKDAKSEQQMRSLVQLHFS